MAFFQVIFYFNEHPSQLYNGEIMKIYLLLCLCFLFSALNAQQAERDSAEATDKLDIQPLKGLRPIDLCIEKDVFEQLGMREKQGGDAYYFKVDGDSEFIKVSYFGDNLSDYVINVEPSYKTLKSYRNLKATHAGMLYGGLALTILGGLISYSDKDLSPTLLVGVGTASLSWIPSYFSSSKIPEAIGKYNESVSQFHAQMQ